MTFDRPQLFIGGDFVAGAGAPVAVTNPATGKRLGAAATANNADIDKAVAAAKTALAAWAATHAAEHADILDRFAAAPAARDHPALLKVAGMLQR